MDPHIAASARALAAGDVLGALKQVALRDDPPALALRGIAMARLGEYPRARELLRHAARRFGAADKLARARCVVAEAELALAMRDLDEPPRGLALALAALDAHADQSNAAWARLITARRYLLLGHLGQAKAEVASLNTRGLPPPLAAVGELITAELALRALDIGSAKAAFARALAAAHRSRLPALLAEIANAQASLDRTAAQRLFADREQELRLDEVAALLATNVLVVDGCRRGLGVDATWQPLAGRPMLFTLARALAQAWPDPVDRNMLIARAFRTPCSDESHRARLRVEIGRLRALIAGFAHIEATARGFALRPHDNRDVVVLTPPVDGDKASLVALLADGAAWSSSALALALGTSQRTVQRALVELEAAGQARSIGRGRSHRWLSPPLTKFTTILLLPTVVPKE